MNPNSTGNLRDRVDMLLALLESVSQVFAQPVSEATTRLEWARAAHGGGALDDLTTYRH